MKIQVMECPNCHASLDNDTENLGVFFCKYCGQKIVVEELQDAALKVKVREMEIEHEEKKLEFEQKKQNTTYQQEKEKNAIQEKQKNKSFWMAMAVCGGMILIGFLMMYSGSFKHNLRVKQLRKVEAEVQTAIQEGNYDYAMIKVNELRLDENYSKSQTEAWDEKREDYIKLIESKR